MNQRADAIRQKLINVFQSQQSGGTTKRPYPLIKRKTTFRNMYLKGKGSILYLFLFQKVKINIMSNH